MFLPFGKKSHAGTPAGAKHPITTRRWRFHVVCISSGFLRCWCRAWMVRPVFAWPAPCLSSPPSFRFNSSKKGAHEPHQRQPRRAVARQGKEVHSRALSAHHSSQTHHVFCPDQSQAPEVTDFCSTKHNSNGNVCRAHMKQSQ